MTQPFSGAATPAPLEELEAPAAIADPAPACAAGSLRRIVVRGTLINGGFDVGLAALTFLRPFVVARFITRAELGFYGIVVVSLMALVWFKQIGIGDKYIQQDEADQELAFHKAYTLELAFSVVLWVLILASLPLFAVVYGRPEIVVPGAVLSLIVPLSALRTPIWVFYRRLEFGRQRRLEAIDPLVALIVTVALAVAGAGYWALVVGTLAGVIASAAITVRASPYRLALRYTKGTLASYASFSWPLLAASLGGLVVSQGSVIAGSHTVGLAGLGVIALAHSLGSYTNRVDAIVTRTLYPVICLVRERADLLLESFTKSNRLALMWGMPFGVGLALFAPDLVAFVLGARWRPAVGLLEAFGLIAGFNQLAFNWTAFLRARDETRPLAGASAVVIVTFLAVPLPLLIFHGLGGYALGMGVLTAVIVVVRLVVLSRIFSPAAMLRHSLRAIAPSVPAAGAILALRLLEHGPRGVPVALAELALYLAVTAGATIALERPLLREVLGYLRPASRPRPGVAR